MNVQDQNISIPNGSDGALATLKQILLAEDRLDIESIRDTIYTKENLSQLVSPIVVDHIENLKQNYPKEFQVVVNNIIEEKLRNSQNEIVDIIYPKLGLLIRKFIASEIDKIKTTIDQKVNNTFSWRNLKAKIFGIKPSESAFGGISNYKIEQVFIIKKESGLLIANASGDDDIVDEDAVAGMLTAIKAFVEDAFEKEKQELEMIKYNNYSIYLHSLGSYYFTIVLSGSLSSSQNQIFDQEVLKFSSVIADSLKGNSRETAYVLISEKLKSKFIDKFSKH